MHLEAEARGGNPEAIMMLRMIELGILDIEAMMMATGSADDEDLPLPDMDKVVREKNALFTHNPKLVDKKEDSRTALHDACMYGWLDWAKTLITKYKANIEAYGGSGRWTPLCYAVTEPTNEYSGKALHPIDIEVRTELVKFLLENGANPNLKHLDQRITPLGWACLNGFYEIAALLIQHGADVNWLDGLGCIALDNVYSSAKVADERMIALTQVFIHHGVDLNLCTTQPILHSALLLKNCQDLVVYLVSNGASIETRNGVCRDALDVWRMYCPQYMDLPDRMKQAAAEYAATRMEERAVKHCSYVFKESLCMCSQCCSPDGPTMKTMIDYTTAAAAAHIQKQNEDATVLPLVEVTNSFSVGESSSSTSSAKKNKKNKKRNSSGKK